MSKKSKIFKNLGNSKNFQSNSIKIKNKRKLAEFIGILLGDGSLCLKDGIVNTNNRLKITLNKTDDAPYILYIKNLIKDLLGIEPIVKPRQYEKNTVDVFIFNKNIILFLIDEIGLKLSPKWGRAIIPKEFLSRNLGLYVLRGYFDTDGALVTTNNNGTIYPRLEMKICPSPMQNQFITLLNQYCFNFGVYKIGKGKVRIQLNGKNELKKWIKLVGFSNKKHISKIKRFL
ncbi:MAG: hypothetical protein KKC75_08920 [Nanoarchaeota archaeon]|nr:hypothetical protein [Nanoarchaeota archaeon]